MDEAEGAEPTLYLYLLLVQEKLFSFFTHVLHFFKLEYDCDDYADADDDDFGGRVRVWGKVSYALWLWLHHFQLLSIFPSIIFSRRNAITVMRKKEKRRKKETKNFVSIFPSTLLSRRNAISVMRRKKKKRREKGDQKLCIHLSINPPLQELWDISDENVGQRIAMINRLCCR